MDALELLEQDHERARDLMKQFRENKDSENPAQSEQLVRELSSELMKHSLLEEEYFYPAVMSADMELRDQINEGFEEHALIDQLVTDLMELTADEPDFLAKATVMCEITEHHMDEEEQQLFPAVRASMLSELEELGQELQDAKEDISERLVSGEKEVIDQ